jgi:hypothetical protein
MISPKYLYSIRVTQQVEAKRAVPRAENSRETSSSSTRGNVSSVSSVSSNSSLGATKKIFVGGLHYETKDGMYFNFILCSMVVENQFYSSFVLMCSGF